MTPDDDDTGLDGDDPSLDFPAVDRFLDSQRRLLDDGFDLEFRIEPDDGGSSLEPIAATDPDWEPD